MKKYLPVMIGIVALLAFGFGCAKDTNTNQNTNTDDAAVLNEETNLNDSLDLNTSIDESDLNLNAADDETADTNENANTNAAANTNTSAATNVNANSPTSGTISITSPKANDELVSPFYVEGTATSGDAVYARLVASGTTIFTEKITVRNGAFRGKLLFDFSHTTSGTIQVFQKDADGNETGLASVPVRFKLSTTNTNANTNTSVNSNANTNS